MIKPDNILPLRLWTALLTLLISACATSAPPAARSEGSAPIAARVLKADVRLRQMSIAASSDTANGTVDVILGIANPRGTGLTLTRITYALYADTILVGSGQISRNISLAARDSVEVGMAVRYSNAGLGAAGRAALARSGSVMSISGTLAGLEALTASGNAAIEGRSAILSMRFTLAGSVERRAPPPR
jgi:hypothetical protein